MQVLFVAEEVEFGRVTDSYVMLDLYNSGLIVAGDYSTLCDFYLGYHEDNFGDRSRRRIKLRAE